MTIERLAMLSVHTSPLAPLGGKKTGGMNVYVRQLAQELGRRGIGVDIYTRRTQEVDEQPEIDTSLGANVRVIHIAAGPTASISPDEVYPHLSQFTAGVIAFTTLHHIRYDVIYSHYWLSGVVAHKLKEVWGTPFVHMFHTLGHMKNRILTRHALPDTRIHMETEIIDWADRIIAATPAEQAQLLWLYRADRRKIVIASPGVDTERFQPIVSEHAKAALGIAPDTNVLLFVGRIEPLKAVDTLILALDDVRRRDADLLRTTRLLIVGGEPNDIEITRLKALAEQLGLSGVVEFLGAKDQGALPCYYAAAAVVLVPSDYESFGMVALEAMASGTPVIASEVGGLAFVVRDGETGYLVPAREPEALAERIVRLLREPEKLIQMRRAAAKHARRYTWSAIADQLLPTFESLANRRTSSEYQSQAD
jgi:D-inositol-3-phosphate glycosyltransferase